MNIKYLLVPMFLIIGVVPSWTQPGLMPREGRDRIEAQRVAFITQRLQLTPDEASRFWPVYNEYRNALKDMRDDFERPDLERITDEEAAKVVEQHLQKEQRKLELKRTLITRLRTIISSRKVLLLQVAENEFNRELLRKVQEHRKP